MTRYFLLLFFVVKINLSSAQTYVYHSLIDTNLAWYNAHDIAPLGRPTHWEWQSKVSSDTSIKNGESYRKVYRLKNYSSNQYESFITSDGSKNFYTFNDNKKTLLYNFGANVGDTLYWSPGDTVYSKVISIDSIVINNELRRILSIYSNWHGPHWFGYNDYWIEGVGSYRFGLLSAFSEDIGFGLSFCSVYEKNVMLYQASTNCYQFLDVKELETPQISLYPNPTTDKISLGFGALNGTSATVAIWDMQGRIMQSQLLSNDAVDMSKLSTGTYILEVKLADGRIMKKKIVKE